MAGNAITHKRCSSKALRNANVKHLRKIGPTYPEIDEVTTGVSLSTGMDKLFRKVIVKGLNLKVVVKGSTSSEQVRRYMLQLDETRDSCGRQKKERDSLKFQTSHVRKIYWVLDY
uniref:Uncharacterized protein n=1 Tax=Oryza meridionalis TaxID=40149 RepID=A0A0E0BZQ4_9ORYZ